MNVDNEEEAKESYNIFDDNVHLVVQPSRALSRKSSEAELSDSSSHKKTSRQRISSNGKDESASPPPLGLEGIDDSQQMVQKENEEESEGEKGALPSAHILLP